jgi:PAS domain S-box-containing protein
LAASRSDGPAEGSTPQQNGTFEESAGSLEYRELFRRVPTPLLVLDAMDLRVRSVNDAATRALGYTEEELCGRSLSDLLAPEERERLSVVLQRSDLSDLVAAKSGWDLVRRGGGTRHVEVSPRRVVFHGRPSVMLFEPPEPQEAPEDVDRAAGDLPEISYVALHDLKEPLNLVKGYLGLLQEHASSGLDPVGREYLDGALEGAMRLQTVVLDMLEFLRVGARPPSMEPVDMDAVWEEAKNRLRLMIESSGANVENGPLPRLIAERSHMERLLENLLGNALKFNGGDRPPEVHLQACRVESGWEFALKDNGIGIEPKDIERVLEPFQRVYSSDRYPGTGLGLAICRKIVGLHGGRLCLESVSGVGTTVRFFVPDDGGGG